MKRRLLLMALATTMVASTLLVGCGSSDEGGNNSTTSATSVVQGNDDSSVDTTTKVEDTKKEESTSSKKEEAKAYDEKFYDEPNWEEEYQEDIADGWKEEDAKRFLENDKRKYEFMKYVYEDMTRRFKNKEEVTATEVIEVAGKEVKSFVCDVTKIVPEEDKTYISEDKYSKDYTKVYERGVYEEFAGFKAKSTKVTVREKKDGSEGIDYFYVELKANKIEGKGIPMWIGIRVNVNEDGTYSYRTINIDYELYDYVYHE